MAISKKQVKKLRVQSYEYGVKPLMQRKMIAKRVSRDINQQKIYDQNQVILKKLDSIANKPNENKNFEVYNKKLSLSMANF